MRRPETDVAEPHKAANATPKPQDTRIRTAKLIGERMEVTCRVSGFEEKITWDTGAQVSLVSEAWLTANLQPNQYEVRPMEEITQKCLILQGVGSVIPYRGFTELSVQLGKNKGVQAVIVPFLVTSTPYQIPILGSNIMDVLLEGDCWRSKLEQLANFGLVEAEILMLTALLNRMKDEALVASVTVGNGGVVVPANSSEFICCRTDASGAARAKPVLFQPNADWQAKYQQLSIHPAVVSLEEGGDTITIIIINNNNEDFHVKEGEVLGTLEEVQILDESEVQCHFFETVEVNNMICVEK